MTSSPIITFDDLNDHSSIRLLYVPAGNEHPANMTRVPIAAWIETAKRSQTGFDDLEYWQAELEKLGIGPDTLTVVVDDGSMTEARGSGSSCSISAFLLPFLMVGCQSLNRFRRRLIRLAKGLS